MTADGAEILRDSHRARDRALAVRLLSMLESPTAQHLPAVAQHRSLARHTLGEIVALCRSPGYYAACTDASWQFLGKYWPGAYSAIADGKW